MQLTVCSARAGGGKCLVHCFAGKSRSAAFVLAYLMKTYNVSLGGCLAYLKVRHTPPICSCRSFRACTRHKPAGLPSCDCSAQECRPIVQPNAGFTSQLLQLQRELKLAPGLRLGPDPEHPGDVAVVPDCETEDALGEAKTARIKINVMHPEGLDIKPDAETVIEAKATADAESGTGDGRGGGNVGGGVAAQSGHVPSAAPTDDGASGPQSSPTAMGCGPV